MPLIISAEESATHKAAQIIVDGDQATWVTPASQHPDDHSVDVQYLNSRTAWIAIRELAKDGVNWHGEVQR